MYVFGSRWRRRRGEWMRGMGLGFAYPIGTRKVLDVCVFGLRWCRCGMGRGLGLGSGGWSAVMSM